MPTDTLIWLFLIIFMLHDFEEIIMMAPWLRKNAAELTQRFPRFAPRMLALTGGLSTPAFALAVMVLFAAIAALTVVVVELRLYALWSGMVLVFSIHFVMHILQWAIMRRYVPVIVTSLLSVPYWVYALWHVLNILQISPVDILLNALLALLIFGAVFAPTLKLAKRFDRWLENYAS